MIIIGITGGSGTGKSTVSEIFSRLGANTLDADAVYHKLLNSSAPMLNELKKRFPEAIKTDGRLSRKTLAKVVFSNKEALEDLNRIAHKYVIEETERQIERLYQQNAECLCIDAFALFESGLDSVCDVVIGVIAPRTTRVSRITERDGIDPMSASARINAQPEDSFYKEKCSYIITNDGDLESVEAVATDIYKQILKGSETENE